MPLNHTLKILDVVKQIANTAPNPSTIVQLCQLVASITVTSPTSLSAAEFLNSLTLLANSPINSQQSRDVWHTFNNIHIYIYYL